MSAHAPRGRDDPPRPGLLTEVNISAYGSTLGCGHEYFTDLCTGTLLFSYRVLRPNILRSVEAYGFRGLRYAPDNRDFDTSPSSLAGVGAD